MVKIRVNGKDFEVEPGKNLLHTCLALGFDIPYFCYHPALGSVGACRQCAVKKFRNADDKHGRIIMSCMEPVTEGLIISTDDPDVVAFRKSVIEALMTNHPHDCPVCDEGGECHLQDMTVMTGHNYRRFVFRKRTYRNQDLGPYISHEMNRCIQCYRCVRFYRDYAGGKDLHVFGSADKVYFGRHREGKLESIFSGNLVEVCPTGVFTDKTFSNHFTRKWDLTNAPSICNECSVGCNILVCERYGMVRRIRNRYNHDVNGYFICDRGRFGYEYINGPERIRKIITKSPDPAGSLSDAIKGKKLVGIASPGASLESIYALKTLVGSDNFYHGISRKEHEFVGEALSSMREGRFNNPSLSDIEKCDAVLILGTDPVVTAPMVGLAIRQATRNISFRIASKAGISEWNDAAVRDISHNVYSPLYFVSDSHTGLDDVLMKGLNAGREDIIMTGDAIAAAIRNKGSFKKLNDKDIEELVPEIAKALTEAENPLIVTGFNFDDPGILQSAIRIAGALSDSGRKPALSVILPHCNSAGLGLFDGKSFEELYDSKEEIDTIIILEGDLYKAGDKRKIDSLLTKAKNIILLNHSMNETAAKADILLPSGTFAESTGTIVNNEGRAQRYYRVLPYDGNIKDSWRILSEIIALRDGQESHWKNFDDVAESFAGEYPFYRIIKEAVPGAGFRQSGEKVPRQTPRFSGRTAMTANINVHEPEPPEDNDSPLAFSMEGYRRVPSSYLVPWYWAPGWNSPQASNLYLEEPGGYPPDGNPGVRIFDAIRKEELKR